MEKIDSFNTLHIQMKKKNLKKNELALYFLLLIATSQNACVVHLPTIENRHLI